MTTPNLTPPGGVASWRVRKRATADAGPGEWQHVKARTAALAWQEARVNGAHFSACDVEHVPESVTPRIRMRADVAEYSDTEGDR